MADYTQPDYVTKRLRYYYGQFLEDQDFVDEQLYHLDRERRLARSFHSPGVVEGLQITSGALGASVVTVGVGMGPRYTWPLDPGPRAGLIR
jgi:hypothetical protein